MVNSQYPIGKFQYKDEYTKDELNGFIKDFSILPGEVRKLAESMSPAQLKTSYREGGWSAAQVIHHIADSQINFYVRVKLALTEETPTIKPYIQEKWAETAEAMCGEVVDSLDIIDAIHKKIVYIFNNLKEKEWEKQFFHPDSKRNIKVSQVAALYSWHLRHHFEHLKICASN